MSRLLRDLVAAVFLCASFPVCGQVSNPPATPTPPGTSPGGEITAGAPRVWRYSRVFPLIDGLLRDIEAAQVKRMGDLDPNAVHSTAVDILQQSFRGSVSYDQSVGANNRRTQRNQAINDRIAADQQAGQLREQTRWDEDMARARQRQSRDRLALQAAKADQASKRASLAAATDLKKAQAQQEYDAAAQNVADAQTAVDDDKTDIAQLGTRPTVTPAPDSSLQTSTATLPDLPTGEWSGLPKEVRDQLIQEILKTPALPATKQLDNHITVLYERMARELDALADDASREGRTVYLMGFDVGLWPTKHEKNKVAWVQYTLSGCSTKQSGSNATQSGGEAYALQLTPGMSAYNMAEYTAKSNTLAIAGAFKWLTGLGASADYKRMHEQMSNGLTQSVYTSGFGSGTSEFGWRFGAAPTDRLVTPGERSVYALVSVPNKCLYDDDKGQSIEPKLQLSRSVRWQKRDDWKSTQAGGPLGKPADSRSFNDDGWKLPKADAERLKIKTLAYTPRVFTTTASEPKPESSVGTLLVELTEDMSPETVVTVDGVTLKRVRDWRGRATRPDPDKDNFLLDDKTVSLSRGALETDEEGPDTWIATDPRTLLINVRTATAGWKTFPAIRLHANGHGNDLVQMLDDRTKNEVEVRVGNLHWKLPKQGGQQGQQGPAVKMETQLLPLQYLLQPEGTRTIEVSLSKAPDASGIGTEPAGGALRIAAFDQTGSSPVALPTATQVVLINSDQKMWPLLCAPESVELVCALPLTKEEARPMIDKPVAVSITAPGVAAVLIDTKLKSMPDIRFSNIHIDTSAGSGGSGNWVITMTAENVTPSGSDGPSVYLTDSQPPLKTTVLSGSGSGTKIGLKLCIPFARATGLSDDLEVRDQGRTDLLHLRNLKSSLLPQVTGYDGPGGRTLRGRMLASVDAVHVGAQADRTKEAKLGIRSNVAIQIPADTNGEGLVSLMVGDVAVPAVSPLKDTKGEFVKDPQTGQVVVAQLTGGPVGTDKVFYITGTEPKPKADETKPAEGGNTATEDATLTATVQQGDRKATATIKGKNSGKPKKNGGTGSAANEQAKPANTAAKEVGSVSIAPSAPAYMQIAPNALELKYGAPQPLEGPIQPRLAPQN